VEHYDCGDCWVPAFAGTTAEELAPA
jgi:hypothetical protein